MLCALRERGAAQVWDAFDPDYSCRIDEGPAGVASCRWAPGGRTVLVVADFCVRMAAWSLLGRRCEYLPGPKHPNKGLAFSPDGGCMAVLEVRRVGLGGLGGPAGWG